MAENLERRTLLSYGSNFRIDVHNPQTTVGGEDVYNIYGITKEDDVCLAGLQENGIYRIYNDRTVEIVGGQKSSENGVDVIISGKNGDVIINADKNGRIRIKGKNVIIQADEDVDIQGGRNVNISAGSGRVLLGGNTLEKNGLIGNLLDPEQQWAQRVFDGTGLPGGDFAGLVFGFSGITDIATQLVSNPAAFGQVLQGSIANGITNAVSGALGGDLSGLAGGALSGALSGAGLGNIAGSLAGNLAGSIGGVGGDLAGSLVQGIAGGSGIADIAGSLAGGALDSVSPGLGGIIENVAGGDFVGIAGDLAGNFIPGAGGDLAQELIGLGVDQIR